MVSFRAYATYLLFLLLVKFHGSGKCEIYSPVQKILQCFFTMGHSKLRQRKRLPLIPERDVRPNNFRTPRWLSTVFVSQNLDMIWDSNPMIVRSE